MVKTEHNKEVENVPMTAEIPDIPATLDDPEEENLQQLPEQDDSNTKTELAPMAIAPVSDTNAGDAFVKIEENVPELGETLPSMCSAQDSVPIWSTSDSTPSAPPAQNPSPANSNTRPQPLIPTIQVIHHPVAQPLQMIVQTPVTRPRRRRRLPLKPCTVKESEQLALRKDPNYTPKFKVTSAAPKDPWLPRLRTNPGRWPRGHIRHFPRLEFSAPTHPVFGFRMRHDNKPTICRKPPSQGFRQMAGGRYPCRITPSRSGVFNYSKDTILLHHYHDEHFHKKGFMQPQRIWCTTGRYYSTLINK